MEKTEFVFTELQYALYLTAIEKQTGLHLTEFEAGLSRAILDIRAKEGAGGACLGSHFKKETKRFIKEGLIHADTFKFTGVATPTGKLKNIIISLIGND